MCALCNQLTGTPTPHGSTTIQYVLLLVRTSSRTTPVPIKERVGGNEHATANPNSTGKGPSSRVTVEPVEHPVSYADVVRGKSSK